MIIPTPQLDDRNFEQLRAEAIDYVRQRGGAWNDLGDGDPGTVLLEAFAYLTDLLLYRVNRVPDKARREYLGLLGVSVTAPAAAVASLRITRDADAAEHAVELPAGTTVTATGSTGRDAVMFVIDDPVQIPQGVAEIVVEAHHCEQVSGELLGVSNGNVGQQFALGRAPVVLATGHELDLVIGVEAVEAELAGRPDAVIFDGRAYALWDVVDSFAGSKPDRRAVRVDRASGVVTFAPAVRLPTDGGITEHPVPLAGVPAPGRQIRAWYRTGGGSRGNVAAERLNTFEAPAPSGLRVSNPQRAIGGADMETLDAALRRAPELLHEPRRAVTADDFEALATREGGIARARAMTEAEQWAHATPGTVEVRLVPAVDEDEGPPDATRLRAGNQEPLRRRAQTTIEQQQPLGVRSVVRWAQYKEVTVRLRVVVGRTEDAGAVKRRVEDRLHRVLSPTPTADDRRGWPFGQALRASNVYSAVFSEPGVRYADKITMEVSECPDGDVRALVADRFQRDTWYVAQGATLFRSENGGLGWEALHRFPGGTISKIVPADDRPGHVAAIVDGDDGRASRVYASVDAGATWSDEPVAAFSWGTEEATHAIRDVCWLPQQRDDLAVATDRGLYRVRLAGDPPRPWVVDPSTPDAGCWAVAASPAGDGGLEVAVAMRSRGGVWLIGPDLEEPFRPIGLDGVDIRALIVERRNIRSFLWAPAFATGDDAGTGCHRVELRGGDAARLDWVHLGSGWNGGICHDLAFVGDQVLAASEFNGVLVLDQRQAEAAWRPPSVQRSGLPLLENRRFQPVRSVDAAAGVALAGTGQSVHRTTDGVSYRDAARRRVRDVVTLPASWLFSSGRHEVVVETEAS